MTSTSNKLKRKRESEQGDSDSSSDVEILSPIPKKRKLNRPRRKFMDITSKSAKYEYAITFATEKANSLIFPDEIIEIILSYFHIFNLYLVRQDKYFAQVTDIMIKSDPNYLHQIFKSSTEIKDLCQLIKYDPKWFKLNILNRMNVEFDSNQLRNYVESCLSNAYFDDNLESIKNLKLSLPLNSDIINQQLLQTIVQKMFIMDKSTYQLVYHLRRIGLKQMELYHKLKLLK